MPHIIVEYSSDIQKSSIEQIQKQIQKIISSIKDGNFDFDHCKTRSISYDDYFLGGLESKDSSFVHVTIKILAGRSVEIKQQIGSQTIDFLKDFIENEESLQTFQTDLSVDVVEMDRDTYIKTKIS